MYVLLYKDQDLPAKDDHHVCLGEAELRGSKKEDISYLKTTKTKDWGKNRPYGHSKFISDFF
jgi:hypothetical protein